MYAALGWDGEHEGGRWLLRIVMAVNGEVGLSPLGVEWTTMAGPPPLFDRYDALATLGYEIVPSGSVAWTWTEGMADNGSPMLAGHVEVRPVVSLPPRHEPSQPANPERPDR